MTSRHLPCCCSRIDCDALLPYHTAIEDLERDVHEAGKVGQALLTRHEQYIASAEAERHEHYHAMEALKHDKGVLEASNARWIQENRTLLDHLERLSSAATDSESHINSLNHTLDSTRRELQRVASLAQKATQLEQELAKMEVERSQLDMELALSKEEKQAAKKQAERAEDTIVHLQDQLNDMDDEARNERRKHDELVLRLAEARRAQVQATNDSKHGICDLPMHCTEDLNRQNTVAADLMKLILEDNSRLQQGNLELRELLGASDQELKVLQAQLDYELAVKSTLPPASQHLEQDIETNDHTKHFLKVVPELQAPDEPLRAHLSRPVVRKRRLTSVSARQHKSSTLARSAVTHGQTTTIPENTVDTLSLQADEANQELAKHKHQWSVHSVATETSLTPSIFSLSPRQPPSGFEPFDTAFNQTQNTTPASSTPGSPRLGYRVKDDVVPGTMPQDRQWASLYSSMKSSSIHQGSTSNDIGCSLSNFPALYKQGRYERTPTLKSTYIETLHARHREDPLSISGMDIHISNGASRRLHPSCFSRFGHLAHSAAHASLQLTTATVFSSVAKVQHQLDDSARALKKRHDPIPCQAMNAPLDLDKSIWQNAARESATVASLSRQLSKTLRKKDKDAGHGGGRHSTLFRSTGINQSGPIYGIIKPQPPPVLIQPKYVDSDLLRESLKDY